jgi:hypothetical protein
LYGPEVFCSFTVFDCRGACPLLLWIGGKSVRTFSNQGNAEVTPTDETTSQRPAFLSHIRVNCRHLSWEGFGVENPLSKHNNKGPKGTLLERYIMQRIYTQSRSSHRRGFTGTFVRSSVRTRGAHDTRTLVRLITVEQASERLGFSTTALELGAHNGLVPHYYILGHTRFEPAELDRWIRQHHFDVLSTQGDLTGWGDLEDRQ